MRTVFENRDEIVTDEPRLRPDTETSELPAELPRSWQRKRNLERVNEIREAMRRGRVPVERKDIKA